MTKFLQSNSCNNCDQLPPLFDGLKKSELEIINKNKYEVNYKPKEIIFKQGTSLTHLCCLSKGLVMVYIEVSGDRNFILRLNKPPEIIGGPGLYVDDRHHFTVSAITETSACFIDAEVFSQILTKNGKFAIDFLKIINNQGIYNFERFVSLTQKQMQGRIADALIYLSQQIYEANPFELSITRQDIADLTALSKESVIRILKDFSDNNIIKIVGPKIEILNQDSLDLISKTG